VRFPLLTLLLCGLASFFVVQLVKVTFSLKSGRHQITKMVTALVVSAVIAYSNYPHHPRNVAIYGLAGAGLAFVIHKVYRVAGVAGDWLIQEILTKRGR
jgi:hypothetical protein